MAIETRISKADNKPRYYVRIEIRSPDGKRKQQRVGVFTNKKKAELAEAEALTKRETGTLLSPDRTTLAELMSEWLESKRNQIGSNSWYDYELVLRKHVGPVLGDIPIQKLTAAKLQSQYNTWATDRRLSVETNQKKKAGLSARMIRSCHDRISQSLDYAVSMKLLMHNVAQDAHPPRVKKKRPVFWDAKDAAAFLKASEADGLHPLWIVLLREGCRRAEALGLRWQDIDWDKGVARIQQTVIPDKTNKGAPLIQPEAKTDGSVRTITLSVETLAALKERRRRQAEIRLASAEWTNMDLVFTTRTGGPLNPNNIRRNFNKIVAEAGVKPITPHGMRHTNASLQLMDRIPVSVVAERLGHADASTTLDVYGHVIPGAHEAASSRFSEILRQAAEEPTDRDLPGSVDG